MQIRLSRLERTGASFECKMTVERTDGLLKSCRKPSTAKRSLFAMVACDN